MDNGMEIDCGSQVGFGDGRPGESNEEECETTVIEQQ